VAHRDTAPLTSKAFLLSKDHLMHLDIEAADRIRELLTRNLQEVFGEGDAVRRRAAIEELWAEDGVLYVPPGPVVGHDAIDRFAGMLRATGEPQILHNAGRLGWGSGLPSHAPDYTGWDVIIVRDGRIAAMYVFLDEMSEEFRRAIS
jgi:hypothetical protein